MTCQMMYHLTPHAIQKNKGVPADRKRVKFWGKIFIPKSVPPKKKNWRFFEHFDHMSLSDLYGGGTISLEVSVYN